MEIRTVSVTQGVYEAAQRLIEATGPLPALAGMQASQMASKCEQTGDDDDAEHWHAVAALIARTGGNLSRGVEIIG